MNAPIKVEVLENQNNEKTVTETINVEPKTAVNTNQLPPHIVAAEKTIEKSFLCHVCSKSFLHKHHLILHLKVHSNEKDYACEICGRKFRQKSHLNTHNKVHSGRKDFACEHCAKTFMQRGDLKRHWKIHRVELPFSCTFCMKRFADDIERQSHEEACKNHRYKCTICDFETTGNGPLEAHRSIHNGERRFICNIGLCVKAFRLKHHLNVHLKTHAKDAKNYECNICDKRFLTKSNLSVHLKYHKGEKAFECEQCAKRFVHRGDLNRHQKTHEKDPPSTNIKCANDDISQDDKKRKVKREKTPNFANFVEVIVKEEPEIEINFEPDESPPHWDDADDNHDRFKDEVDQHIQPMHFSADSVRRDHLNEYNTKNRAKRSNANNVQSAPIVKSEQDLEKPYVCDICLKHFRLKHHIAIHLKTVHARTKEFQCEICSKNFAQSSHLNLHLKAHTGDKNFPCQYCGKRFIHRGDLHRHLQTHREYLKFPCAICSRRFCDEDAKELHEKTCTNQLYKCTMCDYKTTVKSRFNIHSRVHSRDRQFHCEICPKKFLHKQNLENHLKTHSDERSFQCDGCTKAFRLKAHLQRHLKLHKK